MKSKFLVLLLCIFSITVWGQAPIRTCNTCGKVISTCPYKGNHPVAPKKCGVCGRTNCPQNGHHKKCPTCGKYDFQCRYNCKHPVSKKCEICGKANCAQNGHHEKCSHCGEYDFSCKYNLAHPSCESCKKVVGAKYNACQFNGNHPMCDDCGKPIGDTSNACPYNGKHRICEVCKKPIDGTESKSCPNNGNHKAQHNVTFSCNAPNASLTLDGVPAGQLPITLGLQQGQHTLTIKANGYEETHQEIFVDNNNNDFQISLTRVTPPATGVVKDKRGNADAMAKRYRRAYKARMMKIVGIEYTATIVFSPIGIPLWIVGNKKCKKLEREGFDFNTFRIVKRKKK